MTVHHWRRSGQDLMRTPWRIAACFLPMTGSACFLLPIQDHLPWGGTAHNELILPHQSSIKKRKCPTDLPTGKSCRGIFLINIPSFLACVTLTQKLACTTSLPDPRILFQPSQEAGTVSMSSLPSFFLPFHCSVWPVSKDHLKSQRYSKILCVFVWKFFRFLYMTSLKLDLFNPLNCDRTDR